MDYLRSVLPIPTSQSSNNARPRPSPRHSEESDAPFLTPPPREADPTETPPFVPEADDHTSLNQFDPDAPISPLKGQRPRFYQHRSTASSPGSLVERHASDPIPIPISDDGPRRRNTVHAGKLPRPYELYHHNSPLIRPQSQDESVEGEDDIDGGEIIRTSSPSATVTTDARRRSDISTSAVIDQWLADAEGFRSPCLEHIHQLPDRVLTLPTNTNMPDMTADDAELDPGAGSLQSADNLDDFEGFSGAYPLERADTAPPISVPLEIRLRRASSKQQAMSRRSLPVLRSPSLPPVRTNYDSRRPSQLDVMSWKSSPAPTALTHAWTSRYLPEDYSQDTPGSASKRLSTTLQVVKSRDSVYEVIWEDNVVSGPDYTERAPTLSYFQPTPLSPIMSEGTSHDPESLESNMAAWYWASNEDVSTMQSLSGSLSRSNDSKQAVVPQQAHLQSRSQPSYDDGVPEEPPHERSPSISPDESPDHPEAAEETTSDQPVEDDTSISELASQPRRKSTPFVNAVIDAGERTPSPIANVAPSAITAQKRRELLGNRKISNMSAESELFSGHRDSLVLAHKRLFHEQMEKMHDVYGEEAHDPHLVDLRRATWHKKMPDDFGTAAPREEEGLHHRPMSPVDEGNVHGILVHEAEGGERPPVVKSRSGKHIHLVVEGDQAES